jgi:hypothetical protein
LWGEYEFYSVTMYVAYMWALLEPSIASWP